jgi:hypothetical protein
VEGGLYSPFARIGIAQNTCWVRFDAHSQRGTQSSNPVPSSGESAANLISSIALNAPPPGPAVPRSERICCGTEGSNPSPSSGESANFWFLSAEPAYLHEITVFPNGKHDDQVDSTAQFRD